MIRLLHSQQDTLGDRSRIFQRWIFIPQFYPVAVCGGRAWHDSDGAGLHGRLAVVDGAVLGLRRLFLCHDLKNRLKNKIVTHSRSAAELRISIPRLVALECFGAMLWRFVGSLMRGQSGCSLTLLQYMQLS